MKWSFTGLFENCSPPGTILHVGSKRDITKKKPSPRQSMHNLQREYPGLAHAVGTGAVVAEWQSVALPLAAAAAGCGVFTHNTTAEVHTNTTALDTRRGIFVFTLKLLELIYLQLIKKCSTLTDYSRYSESLIVFRATS